VLAPLLSLRPVANAQGGSCDAFLAEAIAEAEQDRVEVHRDRARADQSQVDRSQADQVVAAVLPLAPPLRAQTRGYQAREYAPLQAHG
jgi:hypothetical protein